MNRFSILGMMGFILALAVAIVALRNANVHWADGLLVATTRSVILAALGGLFGAARARARRLGFVVFGGGYLVLVFLVLSEGQLAGLPTTRLLSGIHRRVEPTRTITYLVAKPVTPRAAPSNSFLFPEPPGLIRRVTEVVPNPSSARWLPLLPGAADYRSFSTVGHSLFTLLAGWIGSVVSPWVWGVRGPSKGTEPAISETS